MVQLDGPYDYGIRVTEANLPVILATNTPPPPPPKPPAAPLFCILEVIVFIFIPIT